MPHGSSSSIGAVVELGSTSVRMAIGQRTSRRQSAMVDQLEQAVGLGRDTFTTQRISATTTERCVAALRSFQRVLNEYGIPPAAVRVVATSAVREARNRDEFVDRLFVATGLDVELLDEAAVSRLTYLATRPMLQADPAFRKADTLVVEVGGGSTETLLFRKGRVAASHVYRLGSLRMFRDLREEWAAGHVNPGILEEYVAQTMETIGAALTPMVSPRILALGSEPRYVCGVLEKDWSRNVLCNIRTADMEVFTDQILSLSIDETARGHGLTYQQAETMAASLFIYVAIARTLRVRSILVGEASLRSGLLSELLYGTAMSQDFRRQTLNSARTLAHRFQVDLRHARHVVSSCELILKALKGVSHFSVREELLLTVAATLHEIGNFVSDRAHHKHSRYLIQNSEVFGLGEYDMTLTALIARYHRRATPRSSHTDYAALPRKDRILVARLAAILRVADALDHTHPARALKMAARIEDNRFVISLAQSPHVPLVHHQVRDRAQMFSSVYGLKVDVRTRSEGLADARTQ